MFNGLLKKYISYFGQLNYIYEKRLIRLFCELFGQYKLKLKLVPAYFPDDAGLKTPDWRRLKENYPFDFSPVSVGTHGTVTFAFARFQYREKKEFHQGLRYAEWLKRPSFSDHIVKKAKNKDPIDNAKMNLTYTIKRKGGYVASKGISCHWQL
jgi:hypothetical protein